MKPRPHYGRMQKSIMKLTLKQQANGNAEVVKWLLKWAKQWKNIKPDLVGKARRKVQLWDCIELAESIERNSK